EETSMQYQKALSLKARLCGKNKTTRKKKVFSSYCGLGEVLKKHKLGQWSAKATPVRYYGSRIERAHRLRNRKRRQNNCVVKAKQDLPNQPRQKAKHEEGKIQIRVRDHHYGKRVVFPSIWHGTEFHVSLTEETDPDTLREEVKRALKVVVGLFDDRATMFENGHKSKYDENSKVVRSITVSAF
ncbi:24490_t:CDS:2, partial [Gigaspora rosea]